MQTQGMEQNKEQKTALPRMMLAAPSSGTGKTLITCGLLQALVNRQLKVASFKCGPDYIDPMFHTRVIGAPSRNLDTFFAEEDVIRYLFGRQAKQVDISVMEGVMGFYDGVAGLTKEASSWDLARVTQTPVVLVVNAKGMSLSVVSQIRGFLQVPESVTESELGKVYEPDSQIRGVILNQVSAMMYPELKKEIEHALPIQVYGYVPKVEDCVIESRHLGLVTPNEIEGLRDKLQRLAEVLEQSLNLDGLLEMASQAPEIPIEMPEFLGKNIQDGRMEADGQPVRIAVARDEAFCFYYEDNLELLQQMGAELVYFSPIRDKKLPEQIQGMVFGGGYPELYARELSENTEMLDAIRGAVQGGIPYLAECGGFMYLHESMEDMNHQAWDMVGVLKGQIRKTERLGRFGYIQLTANQDQILGGKGSQIRGHEFHYFDSNQNGDAFHAQKPYRKRNWECMQADADHAAGFPHLYYYSNPEMALAFVRRCRMTEKQ